MLLFICGAVQLASVTTNGRTQQISEQSSQNFLVPYCATSLSKTSAVPVVFQFAR